MKIITQNKKAFFDYEILDTIETGIVLTGDEVKSLRAGHISLPGSFGNIHDGELYMINCHIAPYSHSYSKADEQLARNRIIGEVSQKGVTLVPLKLYFNNKGKVKVDLAICKHKKARVQKEEIKERDIQRQTRRELKDVYKY